MAHRMVHRMVKSAASRMIGFRVRDTAYELPNGHLLTAGAGCSYNAELQIAVHLTVLSVLQAISHA